MIRSMIVGMSRRFRLLALNPNTSEEVTARFVAEARRSAPGVVIEGVTGAFGARIVSRRSENAIAGHAALDLLARHVVDFDAVILAISFDTALAALAELSPVPVVGITAAAAAAASKAAAAGGLLAFGEASRPLYEDLVASGALGSKIIAIVMVDVRNASGYLDEGRHDDVALRAIEDLVERGAGAVVICGAAVVGIARRLAARATVPVFDGAAPAVEEALRLIRDDVARPVGPPPLAGSIGLSPALTALLAGPTATSPACLVGPRL